MKFCTLCKKDCPDSEFLTTERRGKPYTPPHCKPCRNAYQRARWAAKGLTVAQKTVSDPLNQRLALWFGPADRSQPLRWTT